MLKVAVFGLNNYINVIHGAESFLRSYGFQLVKKFPTYYGTQKFISIFTSATCPYPEPVQSSPCPHIPLPEDPS